MKKINIIITEKELFEPIKQQFKKHSIQFLHIPDCLGYSNRFNFFEFLGATETKKSMLIFVATDVQGRAITRFILKNYDIKNNGISFVVEQEGTMSENVLYVCVVNMGKGEKVVKIIREVALAGATVVDARGSGINPADFFGEEIGSGKELVLSVMPRQYIAKLQKEIKHQFDEESTDVVEFVMPISNFSKLHQNK